MKSYAALGLATMFGVTNADAQIPQVQGLFSASTETDEEKLADTLWYVDGVKGFYSGYYKAFYKTNLVKDSACLDKATVDNMNALHTVIADPMSIITGGDFTKDINLFSQGAEVLENLSACHFEQSAYDLMQQCTTDVDACTITTIAANLEKDMFVLMGKLTSMAETIQGFPADDNGDFNEQMKEFGSDAGTLLRVVFNYKSAAELEREAKRASKTHH